jgi:hypothetical protein
MKIADHQLKAASIERSLGRCSAADYETVIEGAMLAGTHWFNILLHRNRLSHEERDAMHAEFLSLAERRRLAIVVPDALQALDEIERLRTLHVRGDMPGGEEAAATALACLGRQRQAALAAPAAPPA